MNRTLKEILWFCLPFIFAIAEAYILTVVNLDAVIIGFTDSCYITDAIDIAFPLLIVSGFMIYLIRSFWLKFQNKACNYIYLAYNALFIILITLLVYFHDNLSVNEGWAISPPLSSAPQKIFHHDFITSKINFILLLLVIMVLFIYSLFKIVRKTRTGLHNTIR